MASNTTDHGVGSLQETIPDMQAHASDLFTMPSQEISMVSGRTTVYRPVDKTNEGPFEFLVESQGMDYIHLAATRLFLQLKITNADGSDLAAGAIVAPVNLVGNSIFKSIDIDIGGIAVPELGNMNANYKAYIESLLSYSHPAIASHLRASIFVNDTEGKFEEFTPSKAGTTTVDPVQGNDGFHDRKMLFEKSKSVQVMTPVHCDFLQTDKYLPPGVKLLIRFTRAFDSFVLMSNTANANYKLIIEDIKLHIRHVKLNDGIIKQHMVSFQKQPAIFHINKTVLKSFAYPAGLGAIHVQNMFTGVLPKTIIVFMVRANAFHGTYGSNPYWFQHFNMTQGSISVNGVQIPSEPYQPNWANKLYTREYRDLFDNIGISHNDMGNVITPNLFANGAFMMAFDLTPDRCNGRHYHPRQSGTIDLALLFSTDLAASVQIVAFATYDAIVLLDKNNRVTTDISV